MKKLILGFALSLSVLGMAACSSEDTATNKEEVKSEEVATTVSKDAIKLEGEDSSYNQTILSTSEKVKAMSDSEIKEFYANAPIDENRGRSLVTALFNHALGTADAESDYLIFLRTYTGEGYVEYTTKTKEVSDNILAGLNKAISDLNMSDSTKVVPATVTNTATLKETGENQYSFDVKIRLMDMSGTSNTLPTYNVHLETVFNPSVAQLQVKSITLK